MDWLNIGSRIMQLRYARGESQEDVANGIGESRETVRNWEVGTRKLKAESIIKLARYFDVSSDYLLGLSDVKAANADTQAVCEYTGLSEAALQIWQGIDAVMIPRARETINTLLESPHYHELLADLSTYFWAISYESRSGNEVISHAVTESSLQLYQNFIAPAMASRLHDTLAKIKEETGTTFLWQEK